MVDITKDYLVNEWIEYLINNQYASVDENDKLEYHRPITARLLTEFILLQTKEVTREEVLKAIGDARTMPGINESQFRVQSNIRLSEIQVARVFDNIVNIIAKKKTQANTQTREKVLQRITHAIDSKLSNDQRMALWKNLQASASGENINEAKLDDKDISRLLDLVAKEPAKTSWFSGSTKGANLSKEKLVQYWDKEGKPKDSDDLVDMLQRAGLSDQQIKNAFIKSQQLQSSNSDNYSNDDSDDTDVILLLSNYITKNGLKDDILKHLESTYGFKESRAKKLKVGTTNLDEGSEIHKRLRADQYVYLLKHLRTKATDNIPVAHIKNQIVKSWKRGMKNVKHIDRLLKRVDMSLMDIIKKS